MLVVIVRGIAIGGPGLAAGLGTDFTGKGHDEDIAEVGDTCTIEVILSEAFDDAVGIVVAGAPVPAFIDIAGPDLYGAEGNAGANKGMPVSAGADIRIDIGDEDGLFLCEGGESGTTGP